MTTLQKIDGRYTTDVIKHGKKTETFNGCNLEFNGYLVGLNNGYKENGKYVTTDNFIVTSFKNKKEEVNDTKASADILTSGASEPENLFLDERIIHTDTKSKSIFELARGFVFDRVKRL